MRVNPLSLIPLLDERIEQIKTRSSGRGILGFALGLLFGAGGAIIFMILDKMAKG